MTRTALTLTAVLALGCGGGGGSPDASTAPDAASKGTLSFTWSVSDPSSNPLACEDVGGLTVTVTATPAIGGFAQIDSFACPNASGTTRGLDPADYNLAFRLSALSGALATDVVMNGVTVNAGQDSALGNVAFEVVPSGGFHFTVDAGSDPNCDDVASGGAGITALEMELHDDGDNCVATDFCVGDTDTATAGCQGGTTYSNDCAGATTACVDDTTAISVAGVVSGTHHLVLTGWRDLDACFARDSQIVIPGNDLDRDLGAQNLLLQPLCDPLAPDAGP